MYILYIAETKLENHISVSQLLTDDYHKAYQIDADGKYVWWGIFKLRHLR